MMQVGRDHVSCTGKPCRGGHARRHIYVPTPSLTHSCCLWWLVSGSYIYRTFFSTRASAQVTAALHLAIRSGVLGRCPLHHHPHSHPGETREKRPQEPPSTHTTRGTPGFLPGSPPGDKPGFVSSLGFSQGCGKCGFLVFSRVALSGVVFNYPGFEPGEPP